MRYKRNYKQNINTTKNIPLSTQKKLGDAMLKKIEEIIADEDEGVPTSISKKTDTKRSKKIRKSATPLQLISMECKKVYKALLKIKNKLQ